MTAIHVLAIEANRSGGAGVYTTELVRRLAARGHRLTLVGYEATADLDQVCTIQRI